MRRYALRDDQWERIKDILPGREGHVGGTAADKRRFFGLGSSSWTCFHASEIMTAHNVWGDMPSGRAFPGPGFVAPALVARS